ncbi:phosphatidylinositol N-acetylglucosaminyltransferase Ecym_7039 [Eremothecium cymbalariae DBVPG|uniref:Phosphatidylinositol N-acetylglucosaminyltransferase n=1 Tax=Eremothecium cymbalariae (strain CBS 270.75 / DBVPG 7215 / KCTC 17166 / NRRL Y-17582) TaxID=931890 RepID=G8JVN0_ERECY|nr:hypothetical protein Ecym_7039 [Eremothecium cymbalariae DBVPG\
MNMLVSEQKELMKREHTNLLDEYNDCIEWQRLLWLKQPYPDNYTDSKFLEVLSEIKCPKPNSQGCSDYFTVMIDFLTFHHTLVNSSLIYVIFILVYRYHYSPIALAGITTLFSSFSYHSVSNLKSSMIIVFTMLTLSPILKTLSRTTTSDSIWNLSSWLTIIYVVCLSCSKSSVLPTNILLSNVTVLASRLNTTPEVFCFLLICIELNIFLPSFESKLRFERNYIAYSIIIAVTHVIVYTFITMTLGWSYSLPMVTLSIAFIFILPWYFIHWQRNYYRGHQLLSTWDAKIPILD